jgi:hypothetical protein
MKKFYALIVASCFAILTSSGNASEPSVDTIDYTDPNKYLEIDHSLGDRKAILAQANKLKGDSEMETLRNVLNWMQTALKYDGEKAYAWRNYDDVVREKTYGGCADEGIVCGVLLKGAGIPTVWVKTMDVAWIWDFKKGRPFKSWSGHVFLEVFAEGKWMLLDPGGRTIYQGYSTQSRILPGNRFAYHKGNDPKTMIMSLQWEEWKNQTEGFFRTLNVSLLPVDSNDTFALSRKAYIIGNSPYYQAIAQMATESGLNVVTSFNCEYDTYLPEACGHVLLVETHVGQPIVPIDVLEKYFPGATGGLKTPEKATTVGKTEIVFIEFGQQLEVLQKTKAGEKEASANKASDAASEPASGAASSAHQR